MTRSTAIRFLVCATVMLAVAALGADRAMAAQATSKTLDNLMAAFNGESNANAKYTEFAKKADQEGFAGVAALFRAAAVAEKTHAAGHADVIKQLGGTPKADIKAPDVKSTADNLKAALAGETYERDTMYPEFIAEAKATGNKAALRAFNFAVAAEAEHAKLYTQASGDLPGWKPAKTFFVCPVCGKTVAVVDFGKCPVCFTAGDKYVKVV
jgi:rubrerythrin